MFFTPVSYGEFSIELKDNESARKTAQTGKSGQESGKFKLLHQRIPSGNLTSQHPNSKFKSKKSNFVKRKRTKTRQKPDSTRGATMVNPSRV